MITTRGTQGPFDHDIVGRQSQFKVDGGNDRVAVNGRADVGSENLGVLPWGNPRGGSPLLWGSVVQSPLLRFINQFLTFSWVADGNYSGWRI